MHVESIDFRRRAFGYCRVSTDRQVQHGNSLEAQCRAIELICELEGLRLVEIFTDPATSGSIPLASRTAGAKLLSSVKSGDLIIAAKLDRVSRDALDAAATLKRLKMQNVGLYLRDLGGDCTSSNVSSLIFGLLSNIAEFERARIAERVADAKRVQKEQGRFLGGSIPFGFRLENDFSDPKKQLRVVIPDLKLQADARRLKAQGYTARSAAGELTRLGYKTTHKSVARLWKLLLAA